MRQIKDWLLEDNNPAIQYRALSEIFNQENVNVYQSIWQTKGLIKVLDKLNAAEDINNLEYGGQSALRYLTVLAECGLKKDPRIDRFVNQAILKLTDNRDACCSNALLLRAIVMLGYHKEIEFLLQDFASKQLFDGGFMCHVFLDKKPQRKSCYKATVAALLLYAECKRKNIVFSNTDKLLEYFIKRDVFYTSDKSRLIIDGRIGWRFIDHFFPVEPMRIGLPLILSSLSILGVGAHQALNEAWNILESKKVIEGKQILEGTLTKQPYNFGEVNKENKWITFYIELAIKHKELMEK